MIQNQLEKEYLEHHIFEELKCYQDFYKSLSFTIMQWVPLGVNSFLNFDTYVFSSIAGTLESILLVLKNGRINDAYALLRKYYDSTIINVYTNLYLQDNFSENNLYVEKINNWIHGTETIPEYRIISQYIKESPKLKSLNIILNKDKRFKDIRGRCNDNTHYNFFRFMLLNDNTVHNPNRVKWLNILSKDIRNLFIQHFAYIFTVKENYMMSNDYMDYMEVGCTPIEGSEFWVATFVQKVFDEIIREHREDVANEILKNTNMELA